MIIPILHFGFLQAQLIRHPVVSFCQNCYRMCIVFNKYQNSRDVYLDVPASGDGLVEQLHHVLALHPGAGETLGPANQLAAGQAHLSEFYIALDIVRTWRQGKLKVKPSGRHSD